MSYTQPENLTTITALFEYANDVTYGVFEWGIPLSLFVIIVTFFLMRQYNPWDSLSTASFITLIVCVPLWFLGIVGTYPISVIALLFGIGVVGAYKYKTG